MEQVQRVAGIAPPLPIPNRPAWPPPGLGVATSEGYWLTSDPPPFHEQALNYMMSVPGMSYEDAHAHVEQLSAAPPAPAPNRPDWPPAGQSSAWQGRVEKYLAKWGADHIEDALMHGDLLIPLDLEPGRAARPQSWWARGLADDLKGRGWGQVSSAGSLAGGVADGQQGREWLQADAPAHHEAAVAHMLAHPGMSYESAFDFVSRGH
jgi:hypothetical protein